MPSFPIFLQKLRKEAAAPLCFFLFQSTCVCAKQSCGIDGLLPWTNLQPLWWESLPLWRAMSRCCVVQVITLTDIQLLQVGTNDLDSVQGVKLPHHKLVCGRFWNEWSFFDLRAFVGKRKKNLKGHRGMQILWRGGKSFLSHSYLATYFTIWCVVTDIYW